MSTYKLLMILTMRMLIVTNIFQDAAAETWWSKTPLERRRQKAIQRLQELQAEAEEKAANAVK